MIVIDTSALIAILQREGERDQFAQIIGRADPVFLSVVSMQEAAMVMFSRHGQPGLDQLWQLVTDSDIQIVQFDEAQLRQAIEAFKRYGKGMGTAAKLNMGDCASYALAKSMSLPLLYKGTDFAATDIPAVV